MNQNNTADVLNFGETGKPKLPSGLNVLTILTFVGCAIQLLSALWGFISAKKSYDGIDKLREQMNSESMPGWVKSMMGDPANFEQTVIKSYENRIPILLLSLVAVALCFVGAMQMRKRKKQGYLLYVIGELIPFVTMAFFIGFFALSGFTFIFSLVIAVVFILLYTMQKKHLVN